MKNIILMLVLLGQIYSFAQSPAQKLDATQVIEQLLNTKVFIDYANTPPPAATMPPLMLATSDTLL